MSYELNESGERPIEPGKFLVAVESGLAVIPDVAVSALTGGVLTGPAAVIVFHAITRRGPADGQLMLSVDALASLHGSLQAWRDRLPVAAGDQYDALAAESALKWADRVGAYLDGAS